MSTIDKEPEEKYGMDINSEYKKKDKWKNGKINPETPKKELIEYTLFKIREYTKVYN